MGREVYPDQLSPKVERNIEIEKIWNTCYEGIHIYPKAILEEVLLTLVIGIIKWLDQAYDDGIKIN